jgi:RNA polymerase sigma-54 factor
MIQAMQILQLSSLDLEARVDEELIENPFLEVEEQTAENEEPQQEEMTDTEAAALDGMLEMMERYERDYGDGGIRSPGSGDVDRKFEAMQNTPATYHSLGDALLEQIALSELTDRQREIAEYLIYSLDARGFLPDPLEEIASERGCEPTELEDVLVKLRAATHPALGAADLQECLLLQIDAGALEGYDTPLIRALITEHIEDITTNRLPRIARATGHTIDEVKHALEAVRTLDPVPGREYGETPAETIHPDVVVEEIDGTFEVRLTREGVPELTVSPMYRKMLRQTKRGDSVRKWIKQRLESARWFIDAVEQRQNTLLRISCAVFDRQGEFLRRGVRGLQPLRMLEIAEVAGVHISTVSRAVAGKYAQTPHGILPLRFFFSGGTAKASGGMASQASIKQRIEEFVAKEDPQAPLSDDRLADLLRERDGISIARRTVTKYRKALSIPSSGQRRQY